MNVVDATVAVGLAGIGVISATRTMRMMEPGDKGRLRWLIVLHGTAAAGFWLALAGFFLALGALKGDADVRYLLVIPLILAAIRLLTARALARALPPD